MGKQRLEQQQRQALTARQIGQIKLLELPIAALEERIREEVIANPALEIVLPEGTSTNTEEDAEERVPTQNSENPADTSIGEYLSEDDIPDYKLRILRDRENKPGEIVIPSDSKSLAQYLRDQLALLTLSQKQAAIAEQIIGNLSEDGYLHVDSREVEDYLLFNEEMEIKEKEFLEVLQIVQAFDPPGVAARNLRESILLQLDRLEVTPERKDAYAIVEHSFDDLANKRYERICRELKLSRVAFEAAQQVIMTLNPKPGNGFGSDIEAATVRITPDFMVHANEDGIEVRLNDEGRIPSLRVSPAYVQLTEERIEENQKHREEQKYFNQQVADARWFIDIVQKRRDTLLRCMEVIVSLQEDFFYSGNIKDLNPMILKDVAVRTGHDVSTISRISNEKYVQSDFGIYPLKFFFSEGSMRDDGKSVSTRSVKALLEEIIESEDKHKPFSDEQLVSQLSERGFPVARRTLAKYREMMGILPSRLRRKL